MAVLAKQMVLVEMYEVVSSALFKDSVSGRRGSDVILEIKKKTYFAKRY